MRPNHQHKLDIDSQAIPRALTRSLDPCLLLAERAKPTLLRSQSSLIGVSKVFYIAWMPRLKTDQTSALRFVTLLAGLNGSFLADELDIALKLQVGGPRVIEDK